MADNNDPLAGAAAAADHDAHFTAMENQLANLSQQLQLLIAANLPQAPPVVLPDPAAPAAAAAPAAPAAPALGVAAAHPPPQRRNLTPPDKLTADVDLIGLRAWRGQWDDFSRLSGLAADSLEDQRAIFRLALDPSMRQVVQVALGIQPNDPVSPDDILNRITEYVRAKRNVALDRIAFRECRQGPNESFDDFYMRLRRLSGPAELCATCLDDTMATSIMTGMCDSSLKQKLLALSPFPTVERVVNLCHSEEAARNNVSALQGQLAVSALQHRKGAQAGGSKSRCTFCGGTLTVRAAPAQLPLETVIGVAKRGISPSAARKSWPASLEPVRLHQGVGIQPNRKV